MAKKIIGDLTVGSNVIVKNNNVITSVNSVQTDQGGNVDIPLYSKGYIDQMISMLPVTRVGTMDYLPLNINGSFEGASTVDGEIMPCILEPDGTFVYLRPGTNGSTEGWYYSFAKNVRASTDMNVISTNTSYKPGTITSKVLNFVGSKGSEIIMMKANNGSNDTFIIGLTNGTFDSVSHQYVEVNSNIFTNTTPQYAHIVGSKVYIWCLDTIGDLSPVSISLFTINVQDIRNGVSTSLVKVTGFSGRNIYNDVVSSSPNIKISQSLQSVNISQKPLFLIGTGVSSVISSLDNKSNGYIIAQSNSDASKIRISFYSSYRIIIAGVGLNNVSFGISMEVNVSSLAFTHDFTIGNPIQVSYQNGNVINNNPYDISTSNLSGVPDNVIGGYANLYQSEDGLVFSTIARYISSPYHMIYKSNITNFSNLYNSLNLTTRILSNVKRKIVNPFFGSALGENLIHPRLCSSNKMLIACSSTKNGITYEYDSISSTKFTGTPNYVYSSINGPNRTGFAPNTDRDVIDNTDSRYTSPISIVDQNGTVRMYGSSFIEGYPNKPSGGLLDPNTMTFTGSYSLANASVMGTIKNKILATSGFGNIIDSKLILYYVPENTYSKSFGICVIRLDSPQSGVDAFVVISELDIDINGTVISDATVLSTRSSPTVLDSYLIYDGNISRQGGLTIAKYSDFTYFNIYSGFSVQNQFDLYHTTSFGKIDNSTKLLTNIKTVFSYYLSYKAGTYGAGVIPNIGFGLFEHGDITDEQTKLIFKNYGTTSAQMDAMMSNVESAPISKIVIASQDVPQGFNVYFTQEIPVLLTGKYFVLPAQTINLQTLFANVQNKTFYMYVGLTDGEIGYQISETLLTEELFRVYIGKITTDLVGITSITSEKVTRFLKYRTSVTKRGSAIPSSTGVPSGTGTRWN